MTRVRKKSFILLTILMPFLMALIVFIPMLFSMVKDDSAKEVIVIDKTGKYMPLFAKYDHETSENGYMFIKAEKPLSAYRSDDSAIEAIVCITADLATSPDSCFIYSSEEVQKELINCVQDIISEQVRKDKLAAYNVPNLEVIINDMQSEFNLHTVKWTSDGGETESWGDLAVILGLISALLIYTFVLGYGAMVMQGVMEEKTNRILEVMVCSVRPFQLMMGKIIGIMFVGITQMLVWGSMLAIIMTAAGLFITGADVDADTLQQAALSANAAQQQAIDTMQDNSLANILTALNNLPLAEAGVLLLLYFLGGYMLYASFYAAIGASINSQEDSSQFLTPMMIVMMIALYGALGSVDNTNGPLAFWASMFPLTSPIVMMVRIPFGVPLWQEVLSLVILYATAILFVWVGARIYRIGILMYGKKPTIKEMIKWMSYN